MALINDALWYCLEGFVYVIGGVIVSLSFIVALNLMLFGGTRAERSQPWSRGGAFAPKFEELEKR